MEKHYTVHVYIKLINFNQTNMPAFYKTNPEKVVEVRESKSIQHTFESSAWLLKGFVKLNKFDRGRQLKNCPFNLTNISPDGSIWGKVQFKSLQDQE